MRKRLVFVVAGVVAAAAAVAVFAGGGDIFGDPSPPPDDTSLPPAPTLPPGADCPYGPIGFQGHITCLPQGASEGAIINEIPADVPPDVLRPPHIKFLIRRGKSVITYVQESSRVQLLEFNVAPEDEADFAGVREIFGVPQGVPFVPLVAPLPDGACPYGALAFRGIVGCLPPGAQHLLATDVASSGLPGAVDAIYIVERGASVVKYSYSAGVLEWNVTPEDEVEFAQVRGVLTRP